MLDGLSPHPSSQVVSLMILIVRDQRYITHSCPIQIFAGWCVSTVVTGKQGQIQIELLVPSVITGRRASSPLHPLTQVKDRSMDSKIGHNLPPHTNVYFYCAQADIHQHLLQHWVYLRTILLLGHHSYHTSHGADVEALE